MYYRCIKCNAAIESPHGQWPEECACGSKELARAERNRTLMTKDEVYNSTKGSGLWMLTANKKAFIPYTKFSKAEIKKYSRPE